MKIGTKTLLIGCHQFIIHPLTVFVAWKKLYHTYPSIGETLAIIIHDWGYIGKPNLDGKEGDKHPEWAHNFFYDIGHMEFHKSKWIVKCLYLAQLCLYHSRFYAKKVNTRPSKLCWADKYGTVLMGKKIWSFLAYISGEGKEYMKNPKFEIYHEESSSNGLGVWFDDYVKFITPIIIENVKLINNGENHD